MEHVRKSLFTISSVLAAPVGVMMQTWAALSLLLFFLIVFSLSQPYEQDFLNNLERSALSISVITLLSGLGLFTNDQAGESKSEGFAIFLTFIIVFFNILFVLNIFVTFSKHTTYCKICKKCQKEQVVESVPTRTNSDAHTIAALRLEIKAMKKTTQIVPLQKQSKIFNSIKMKKVLAHSNATKVIQKATVSLKKHKEKVKIEHNNASSRLQLRLSRRSSQMKQNGTGVGGDVKGMASLATNVGNSRGLNKDNVLLGEVKVMEPLATSIGNSRGLQMNAPGNVLQGEVKVMEPSTTTIEVKQVVDPFPDVAKIRLLAAKYIHSSKKLRKMFTKIHKGDASVDTISKNQFEMLISHIIMQKKKKSKNKDEIIQFDKKAVWNSLSGKRNGTVKELVSFVQLDKWLFPV